MDDIIISSRLQKFEKGFLPKEGQKIIIKCPYCSSMYEIKLGQGSVCVSDICPTCEYYFGDAWRTYDIFPTLNIYFAYSNKKFIEPFIRNGILDDNTEFTIAACSVTSEAYFEDWDIHNESLYDIADCMNGKQKMAYDHQINGIIINRDDEEVILYLYSRKVNMDRIYVIDNDYTVKKIDKINISITLT